MFYKIMHKIISWLDPKLDRFRNKTPVKTPPYTPRNLKEFIGVLKRTPQEILDNTARARIAAVMSFDDRCVRDLMTPKSEMVFVQNTEVLGPLVLDKLYKSGFTHFPVVDGKDKVLGVIHTDALNALEIKKTDRASKYLDASAHYLHATDTLKYAVEEIERTGSYFFLVLDSRDQTIGCFTTKSLLDYLLN